MLDFLKESRQRRLLKNLSESTRAKKIANLDDMRMIGIVFTVGSKVNWDILYRFTKELEQGNRTVWLIGYQPKEVNINYIFTHSRMVICHEKTDFNFFGIPKPEMLGTFLAQRYDLLIDTTQEPNFFGKYISLRTQADLKVTYVNDNAGNDTQTERIFDFMLHGVKPVELATFLNETKKYLSMIHK
ncbi:MAG: hypothetical protein SPJ13_04495 [Bacteroidales bacterium]|nr:hypothetical protein [Bacteroidales bacterium]